MLTGVLGEERAVLQNIGPAAAVQALCVGVLEAECGGVRDIEEENKSIDWLKGYFELDWPQAADHRRAH